MAYELAKLTSDGSEILSGSQLQARIEHLRSVDGVRLRRLWAYYRNPMRAGKLLEYDSGSDRPYRQAQEWGMPSRITGLRSGREIFEAQQDEAVKRKEVVIENDIGWRIDTMVDYLFGKPLVIQSLAPDATRRKVIDRLVRAIVAHNGGLLLLQQLALIGAVYGFVDVLVKLDLEDFTGAGWPKDFPDEQTQVLGDGGSGRQELGEPPLGAESAKLGKGQEGGGDAGPAHAAEPGSPQPASDSAEPGARRHSLEALIQRLARMIRLEIVEPTRALPFLSREDYREVDAYGQVYELPATPESTSGNQNDQSTWWQRLWQKTILRQKEQTVIVTEIITPTRWQRYQDEKLIGEGENSLGEIPLVHIQNTAVPFEYAGVSDVEMLIPLQDELNTRLSDRANRIALQSFKMYLGKGIDGFADLPVAPGRMWTTDNTDAEVIEFGGDSDAPAESLHIADIREALDKTSGVTPIAAGAIKNRIGRLTSAAALRITLMSLISRTEKKRTTYGLGLRRIIELSLAWLDRAGVFATTEEERRVELHWPSPLPANELEKLQEGESKLRLGVPKEVVLRELGY